MRKLRPRALWEGREAERVWEIHRTDITSVSREELAWKFCWQWQYLGYGLRGRLDVGMESKV